MPEPAETAILVGGGLMASEAMGFTNATPIGPDSGQGPQIPGSLPQGQGIPPGLLAMLSQDRGIPPGLMGAFSDLNARVSGLQGQLAGLGSGQGNGFNMWGDFPAELPYSPWRSPPGGNGNPSGGNPQGGGNIWQNMSDPEPGLQAGDVFAGAGAGASGTVGTIDRGVGGLVKTGNTFSQATRAILGKEYSPGGTLAEDVLGNQTRQIDYPDFGGNETEGGFRADMFVPGLAVVNEVRNDDRSLINETAKTMATNISPVGTAGASPDPDEGGSGGSSKVNRYTGSYQAPSSNAGLTTGSGRASDTGGSVERDTGGLTKGGEAGKENDRKRKRREQIGFTRG